MGTTEATAVLSADVRCTVVEALAHQLKTDAENLADLAEELGGGETPTRVADALSGAELVAGTARALREITAG